MRPAILSMIFLEINIFRKPLSDIAFVESLTRKPNSNLNFYIVWSLENSLNKVGETYWQSPKTHLEHILPQAWAKEPEWSHITAGEETDLALESFGNCLVLEKDESGKHTTASPVLIAMKRTSLKASRKWNTFIKTRHKVTADGKSITPPRFYWIWDLCTYKENKGGRDYYVWDAKLSDEAEVTDMNIYMQAKAFYDSIKGDAIDVKYEQDAPQAEAPKPATPPKAESKGGQGNMPF